MLYNFLNKKMKLERYQSLLFILLRMTLLYAFLSVSPMVRAEEKVPNQGQDFTRPLHRVDVHWTYANESGGAESQTITLRGDYPFQLSENWKLNTRIDLPTVYNTLSGGSDGAWGFGDMDIQAALIHTMNTRFAMGGGLRAIFPTATEDRFGSESYRLIVGGGIRFMLPEITTGSFFAPQLQYDFNVGSADSNSPTSILRIVPTFNISLSYDQYLTFLDSADIRYDFNTSKWFVPIDVTYGIRWGNILTSIMASYPIVDDQNLYDFKTELRIGYFF